MSAVRMCDRCGVVFSENAEGWGVGSISTSVRDERTGRASMVEQRIDLCPMDNRPASTHLTPAIAGVAEVDRLADTLTAKSKTTD